MMQPDVSSDENLERSRTLEEILEALEEDSSISSAPKTLVEAQLQTEFLRDGMKQLVGLCKYMELLAKHEKFQKTFQSENQDNLQIKLDRKAAELDNALSVLEANKTEQAQMLKKAARLDKEHKVVDDAQKKKTNELQSSLTAAIAKEKN